MQALRSSFYKQHLSEFSQNPLRLALPLSHHFSGENATVMRLNSLSKVYKHQCLDQDLNASSQSADGLGALACAASLGAQVRWPGGECSVSHTEEQV